MKTVPFANIVNQAAECAQRTRDKLPGAEQKSVQGFLATEFQTLLAAQPWPELIPDFYHVTGIVNQQFSLNEGSTGANGAPPEMGDLLAVLTRNPHGTDHWRHVEYSVGDNVVYLDDPIAEVWVEYLLPYPGVTFPDLAPLAWADFLNARCPRRWRNILAFKAAGHLLASDNQAAAAGVQYGLAQAALAAEVMRLPAPPPWRGFRVRETRHRWPGRR